jgi:hypothetical protein
MCITYRQYDALKARCSDLSAELAETAARAAQLDSQVKAASARSAGGDSSNAILSIHNPLALSSDHLTMSALGGSGSVSGAQMQLMEANLEAKLAKSHNENVMLAREFKRALTDAAEAKAGLAALKQQQADSVLAQQSSVAHASPLSTVFQSSVAPQQNITSPTRGGGSKLSHMEMKVRAMQVEDSRLRGCISDLSMQKDDDERRIKQLELEVSDNLVSIHAFALSADVYE